MIEQAKVQLPGAAREDREMVPGLQIKILINRTDSVGMQVSADMKMMTPDGRPFDRVSNALRATMHDDLDRLMNDVNRVWNKSFRDQQKVMEELTEGNPLFAMLLSALGGMPVDPSELKEALLKEGRMPDRLTAGDGSSDSETARTAQPTQPSRRKDPASEPEPHE